MRILLDESLPRRLADGLVGHSVMTVAECGWSGQKNGVLLALAAKAHDVFVTADQNLEYQQNLAALPIAIVVVVARNNRLETLRALLPQIMEALEQLAPRTLVRIGA
ncbi:DUF5615 family PIN-like protein [Ramlibacter sp. G-1-2-2]|uniref:DUF5615 family PIN-like protein n=1 Tax=Ramlibacter agri TaxID=2728837 RepID=A0A848HD87_9BURK|nr:DUF5615 family PIN-like protein [Ramlibacter agri]NML48122.1 DUF5615 family PIN-like protein [Ramlibacter agri]